MGERRMVIGVGNRLRGDDGVGLAVAEALDGVNGVEVLLSDGDPGVLMEAWQGAASVVVVDAMRSGGPAGRVATFDASHDPLPAGVGLGSSHHLGVAEAVELARVLGRLPPRVVIVGVEGASFTVGDAVSPEVAAALPAVVAAVEQEIARA